MGKNTKKRGTLAEQLSAPEKKKNRANADAAMAAALKAGGKKKTKGPKVREYVVRGTYSTDLPVPISEDEAVKCGHMMVREIRKREALDEERREAMANFRQRREAIDAREKELAESFEGHTKRVPVKVEERFYVETNEIQIVRLDTGEVVEKKTADAADRQEALFPGEDLRKPDVDARNAQAAGKAVAVLDAVQAKPDGYGPGVDDLPAGTDLGKPIDPSFDEEDEQEGDVDRSELAP